MEQLALVYFPTSNTERIQSLRKKYDPNWQIISPHITLIQPFSTTDEKHLILLLESRISQYNPFTIHLQGLQRTLDYHLFLLVKDGAQQLINIHKQLSLALASRLGSDAYPFLPHITLGVFQTSDPQRNEINYCKAREEAEKINFPIFEEVAQLSLIKGDGLTPAKLIHTFHLR